MTVSEIPLVRRAGGVPGQISMVVPDLGAALRTWGAHPGRDRWAIWTYGPGLLTYQTYMGEPSPYEMLLALNGSDPILELVQPLRGPSIYHTWLEAGRTGVHHVGYYVDDLDLVVEEMEAAGFRTVQTGGGHGADGSGAFAYWDTVDRLGFYLEGIVVPNERRSPERVWPAAEKGRRG